MDKTRVLIITSEEGASELYFLKFFFVDFNLIDKLNGSKFYAPNENVFISIIDIKSNLFKMVEEIENNQIIILLGNEKDFLIFSMLEKLFLYKKINFVPYSKEMPLTGGKREQLLTIIERRNESGFPIRAIITNKISSYSYKNLSSYFYEFEKLERLIFPSKSSIEINYFSKGSLVQEIVGNLQDIAILGGSIYAFSKAALSIINQGVEIQKKSSEVNKIKEETKKIKEERMSLSIENNEKLNRSKEFDKFNEFIKDFYRANKNKPMSETIQENKIPDVPVDAVNQIKKIDQKFPIEKVAVSLDSNNILAEKELGDIHL